MKTPFSFGRCLRPALCATSPRRIASGLFAAIAIALTLTGCELDPRQVGTDRTAVDYNYGGCTVVKVRDCDYVVWADYNKGGITHAGDCTNPIHRVRAEAEIPQRSEELQPHTDGEAGTPKP